MPRLIDADTMREEWLENGENEYVYDTNAVLDGIDSQPTVNRWIPVTERLPEICENVIVYVVYHSSRCVNVIRSVVPAYYTEDGFWMYGRDIRLQNVTHWMPLPELPKEETE